MFILKFIKITMQYDSKQQRASLVLECIRHPKNEVTNLQATVNQALEIWRGCVGTSVSRQVNKSDVVKNNIPNVILDA